MFRNDRIAQPCAWARASKSMPTIGALDHGGMLSILSPDGSAARIWVRQRAASSAAETPVFELVSDGPNITTVLASGSLSEMSELREAFSAGVRGSLRQPGRMSLCSRFTLIWLAGAAAGAAGMCLVAHSGMHHHTNRMWQHQHQHNVAMHGAAPAAPPLAAADPRMDSLRTELENQRAALAKLPAVPAAAPQPAPAASAPRTAPRLAPAAQPTAPQPALTLSRPEGPPVSLEAPPDLMPPAPQPAAARTAPAAPAPVQAAPVANAVAAPPIAAPQPPSPQASAAPTTPESPVATAAATAGAGDDKQALLEALGKIRAASEAGQQVTPEMLATLPRDIADQIRKSAASGTPVPSRPRPRDDEKLPDEALAVAGTDPWGTPNVPDHDSWTRNGGVIRIPLPSGGDIKRPDDMKLFGLEK